MSAILQPVIALVLWSLVMLVWLYVKRLPAIAKHKIAYDPQKPPSAFIDQIPARDNWPAQNYNHLMEQPTLFYAVALTIALMGAADSTSIWLAWAYVGLRVIHSLVQAAANIVGIRFLVFSLSSLVLAILSVKAALIVF